MRFRCGKNDCPGVTLTGAACGRCGLELTVSGMWRYAILGSLGRLKRALSVQCPSCQGLIPGFQSTCKSCGSTLTFEQAVHHTLSPHREAAKRLIAPTSFKKRAFQWGYVAVSILAFWQTLALLEARFVQDWQKHALLSIVYLAVFLLISLWIIPPRTFFIIAHRASKLIKLGLIFNYLTALFLLQMFMGTWWTRSLMLGFLFFSTWAAAFIFWHFLWPTAARVSDVLTPSAAAFDRNAPQGRAVRLD